MAGHERLEVRVALEDGPDGADGDGLGVDELGRAEAARRHHAGAVGHAAVRERRPVLDDDDAPALDRRAVEREVRAGRQHLRGGVELLDAPQDGLERGLRRRSRPC